MSFGLINRIIDQSLVDGPGNRTVIFLQGCNLNCHYCHNPETINRCLNCGACVLTCPSAALRLLDGKVLYDPTRCCQCDTCLKTCPHSSSPKTKIMSDEQVFQHILLNQAFIRGITVSGGECTLQPEFIKALFKRTKTAGLSNLLDSNGTYDFEHNPDILADCDGVMLDIKAYNSDDHQAITDHDNQRILYNARWLAEQGQLSEIRTVIIPEMLDNKGTIQKIAQLLAPYLSQHQINYKLIKYRPFGVRSRYQTFPLPDNRLMQELARIAADAGFKHITII